MHITYAEYFLGIGAPGKAIHRVTARHGDTAEFVYGFEIDKYARNAFAAIHGVDEDKIYHDITDQPEELPYVDVVFYSPPCQSFSPAGKQEGTTVEKGNLFYHALEGIKKSKPKYAIMENVSNLAQQFKDDFKNMLVALEDAGYISYNKILNSKDYGIPQNRERIFVVSIRKDIYESGERFEFPEAMTLDKRLKDLLEDEVAEKYYLSEKMIKGFVKTSNDKSHGHNFKPHDATNAVIANAGSRIDDNFIVEGYINQDTQASKVFSGEGVSPTLSTGTHGYANGYVKVEQVGNLNPKGSFGGNPQVGRVYSPKGLAPTLSTCGGGGQEPKILVKSATVGGYEEAYPGDSINIEHPNSKTRRGRVGSGVAQTLTTSCNQGYYDGYMIRKLTPLECFRLQGFDDEDYYKAVEAYDKKWKAGASDSQMYKRAGNSITVNVEEELIEQLVYQRKQVGAQLTFF